MLQEPWAFQHRVSEMELVQHVGITSPKPLERMLLQQLIHGRLIWPGTAILGNAFVIARAAESSVSTLAKDLGLCSFGTRAEVDSRAQTLTVLGFLSPGGQHPG